jgi:hypothetical protein
VFYSAVGRVKNEGMMMNWLIGTTISAQYIGSRDLHTFAVSNSKPPVPANCKLVSRFQSGVPAEYADNQVVYVGPAQDHGIRLFDEGASITGVHSELFTFADCIVHSDMELVDPVTMLSWHTSLFPTQKQWSSSPKRYVSSLLAC